MAQVSMILEFSFVRLRYLSLLLPELVRSMTSWYYVRQLRFGTRRARKRHNRKDGDIPFEWLNVGRVAWERTGNIWLSR